MTTYVEWPKELDEIALKVADDADLHDRSDQRVIDFARRLCAEIQARNGPVAFIHPLDIGRGFVTVSSTRIGDEQLPLYTFPPACDELRKDAERRKI